jgi:predicted dehydrogenase
MILSVGLTLFACSGGGKKEAAVQQPGFTGMQGEVKIMTLDPGHFHASLVQKEMVGQIDPVVYVYSPGGAELDEHLSRINGFNNRLENPTMWNEKIYTGPDFFEKMIADKPGNVMVTAGNNAKKTDYILKTIEAGINVLADKPMVITPSEFPKLEQAFRIANEKGVKLYDIMTERFEITNMLEKELINNKEVFGTLLPGTPDDPAIVKESVHHFYKNVSGSVVKRPVWFFDVLQQGEGIADVATHLVDLVQWQAFPDIILKKEDVSIVSARHWTTDLTLEMFAKVTGLENYPDFLKKNVEGNALKVYCNGEFTYSLKGIYTKIVALWNFEAPQGGGDTHYSKLKGTKCNLVILQGAEPNYTPTLYVEATTNTEGFTATLEKAVNQDLAAKYPGVKVVKTGEKLWMVEIPQQFKVGHEAHFTQVTKKYLQYLQSGLPDWEVPGMIVKYYTTTEALKKASE